MTKKPKQVLDYIVYLDGEIVIVCKQDKENIKNVPSIIEPFEQSMEAST